MGESADVWAKLWMCGLLCGLVCGCVDESADVLTKMRICGRKCGFYCLKTRYWICVLKTRCRIMMRSNCCNAPELLLSENAVTNNVAVFIAG